MTKSTSVVEAGATGLTGFFGVRQRCTMRPAAAVSLLQCTRMCLQCLMRSGSLSNRTANFLGMLLSYRSVSGWQHLERASLRTSRGPFL